MTSYQEKRSEPRHAAGHLSVLIRGERCEVHNMNLGGLMASLPTRSAELPFAAPGEEIRLTLDEHGVTLPLTGRVAWVDEQAFRFGVQFTWRSEGIRSLVQRLMTTPTLSEEDLLKGATDEQNG